MDDHAPNSTVRPRKRNTPEVRQAQILDAAYRVFAESGFSDARMDDVARIAGVSKGTIYLYYPTKQALFEALILRDIKPRADMMAAFIDGFDGPVEVVLGRAVEIVATLVESDNLPIYPKLLIREAGRFPELARFHRDEVMGVMLGALSRMFERAMARGDILTEDPDVLAHLFIAPVAKTIIWHFTFGPTDAAPFPVRTHLHAHVRLFMRGLKPSGDVQ